MTESNTLFEAQSQDNTQTGSFDMLVGEGKKFRDQEALAKGKIASDTHITQLEAELKTLREDLQKRLTIEELAEKINTARMEEPRDNQYSQTQTHPQGETISKDEIFNLVKNTINQERTIEQARRNVDLVRQELRNEWGPDFHIKLQQISKDLDISQEFLGSLAESNPQGFLRVVRQSAPTRQGDPNQSIAPRSTTSGMSGPQSNSWQYYEDMRKKNPRQYHSIPIQREIHRLAFEAYAAGKDFIPS